LKNNSFAKPIKDLEVYEELEEEVEEIIKQIDEVKNEKNLGDTILS